MKNVHLIPSITLNNIQLTMCISKNTSSSYTQNIISKVKQFPAYLHKYSLFLLILTTLNMTGSLFYSIYDRSFNLAFWLTTNLSISDEKWFSGTFSAFSFSSPMSFRCLKRSSKDLSGCKNTFSIFLQFFKSLDFFRRSNTEFLFFRTTLTGLHFTLSTIPTRSASKIGFCPSS